MNNNNNLTIISIIGFLVFGIVSCWATSESLHLLLPDFPKVFCWAITIGFYIIAAIGTKMIADSLNQRVYISNRKWRLFGGIIIVLIFWLLCSMPTNTHTFFYRNLISDKVSAEIATTQGYLNDIRSDKVTQEKIQEKIQELRNNVDIFLKQLEAEINHESNPGNGPHAKAILRDLAKALDVPDIKPLAYLGTTLQERLRLCKDYRQMIYKIRETRELNIRNEMTPPNDNYKKIADRDYKNLDIIKRNIDSESININEAKDIKMVCDKINQGYNTIKMNNQFVQFKNNEDKESYTASTPHTKVSRLLSVYDVWVDFLTGKEGGLSFVFWIIISILIDIAAFIFFDIAFKKTDY